MNLDNFLQAGARFNSSQREMTSLGNGLIQDLRNAGVELPDNATISLSKNKIAGGQKSLFRKFSTAECITFDGKVRGVWQGVAMDILKYHLSAPRPTTLLPTGNYP
jgi:hypothetical protein